MLNLLVAIISESFAKINEGKANASYQERAKLISENNYLIPQWVKTNQKVDGHYLILGEASAKGGDDTARAIKPPSLAPEESKEFVEVKIETN
jgi:hypothetical protein